LLGLAAAVGFVGGDLVGEREDRALDELDQPLVHLRLGREVTVERRLRDAQLLGQRSGRDLSPLRLLEHLCQRLQALEPPLPFYPRHGEILRPAGAHSVWRSTNRGSSVTDLTRRSTKGTRRRTALTQTVDMPSRLAARRFSS